MAAFYEAFVHPFCPNEELLMLNISQSKLPAVCANYYAYDGRRLSKLSSIRQGSVKA